MLNKTATAATIAAFAEADLVGSATLIAFTVTVAGEGTLDGGIYSPLLEIVPHAAPVQPAPLTAHVTAVFEVPVTFGTNC
jgi:N-methylhydantoinase B/oxoprolinase/acetone carboxylase alpha subunit